MHKQLAKFEQNIFTSSMLPHVQATLHVFWPKEVHFWNFLLVCLHASYVQKSDKTKLPKQSSMAIYLTNLHQLNIEEHMPLFLLIRYIIYLSLCFLEFDSSLMKYWVGPSESFWYIGCEPYIASSNYIPPSSYSHNIVKQYHVSHKYLHIHWTFSSARRE